MVVAGGWYSGEHARLQCESVMWQLGALGLTVRGLLPHM